MRILVKARSAAVAEAERHADVPGAGARKRKKLHKKGDKFEAVMHEFKHGTLRSGKSGKKVTERPQALAIAASEAGISYKKALSPEDLAVLLKHMTMEELEEMAKAKYLKRTGFPGHYRYIYSAAGKGGGAPEKGHMSILDARKKIKEIAADARAGGASKDEIRERVADWIGNNSIHNSSWRDNEEQAGKIWKQLTAGVLHKSVYGGEAPVAKNVTSNAIRDALYAIVNLRLALTDEEISKKIEQLKSVLLQKMPEGAERTLVLAKLEEFKKINTMDEKKIWPTQNLIQSLVESACPRILEKAWSPESRRAAAEARKRKAGFSEHHFGPGEREGIREFKMRRKASQMFGQESLAERRRRHKQAVRDKKFTEEHRGMFG